MSKSSRNAHQGKRPIDHLLKKRINSPSKPAFVDHLQSTRDSKCKIQGKTGIIYDEVMTQHKCLWDSNYPECPERFTRVLEKSKEYGLVERCEEVKPREATSDELLKLHTPDRLELLQGTSESPDAEALEALSSGYDAIYIHPSTHKLALLAAGSTIELVDSIIDGKVQNGMAIIRPPGHHAMKSEFCGYCFYNNVAVAAQHALDNKGISKILIVDWDVHHGQGTQQMFYNDPRVLYFSIHRYEQGSFWPNLRESDYHNIGEGRGYGFNVNIPLNAIKMGNTDYMAIFHQVLLPLAYEFQPDLVLVSAGFDAALGDEKGEMEITPACYAHLTTSLMGLARGKVAMILEGGYCLKSLAEGAALTLRALLGDPCPLIDSLQQPSRSVRDSILSAIYMLRPLWKCFQFQGRFEAKEDRVNVEENQYRPNIIFLGDDVKPVTYETRNCYPVQDPEVSKHLEIKLDELISGTNLVVPTHRVCLIYDDHMNAHADNLEPRCAKISDLSPTSPEGPQRISAIYELMNYDLINRCHRLAPVEVGRQRLLMPHDANYVNSMAATPSMDQDQVSKNIHDAALLSASSAMQIVDSILLGESRSGICIIRPPGHHAEGDAVEEFCFFSNTAFAVKHAVEIYGLNRVLIVDWDIFHGNGIQHMFEKDNRILYISLHRKDMFPFRPDDWDYNTVGSGSGAGFTVNIPWVEEGMGDAEYLAVFQQVILPMAYQYNPQLVLVVAGFDSAQGDVFGGCNITPEGFGQMTHLLTSLAQGRIAILLEGGYNLISISHSTIVMCCKALLGDPLPSPLIKSIKPSAIETIKRVIRVQQPYWKCFQFLVNLPDNNVLCPPWVSDLKIHQFNKTLLHGPEINDIDLKENENEKRK